MRRLAGVAIRGRLSRQPFPIFKAPVFEKSAWTVNKPLEGACREFKVPGKLIVLPTDG